MVFSISDVEKSGISTLLKAISALPSRAKRARRRMESFSPRLTLSSEVVGGRSGTDIPISSADSCRVETEERRLWWELRLPGDRAAPPAADDMAEFWFKPGFEDGITRGGSETGRGGFVAPLWFVRGKVNGDKSLMFVDVAAFWANVSGKTAGEEEKGAEMELLRE